MDAYTTGLLSLTKVSQQPMNITQVDLSALAREILDQLHEQAPERQLSANVQGGLRLHGDADLLRMALDNLLGNAWKFTAHRPRAEIDLFAFLNDEGELVYCISDNGAGFDMAHAGKLFGSFNRLHSETEFPGTGVGLANVQRIIARHGGRVWADSAVDHGASFFFTFGESGSPST